MRINKEFLKDLKNKTIKEISVSAKIIKLMRANPNITARQISEHLNISFDGVRYHIKKLRTESRIKREGSTKNGKWIVMK